MYALTEHCRENEKNDALLNLTYNGGLIISCPLSEEKIWPYTHSKHCSGGRWSPAKAGKHIKKHELKAVLFALCSLGDNVRNKHGRILSDNTTTVCYINDMGGSKYRACNIIAKNIWQFSLERKFFLTQPICQGSKICLLIGNLKCSMMKLCVCCTRVFSGSCPCYGDLSGLVCSLLN